MIRPSYVLGGRAMMVAYDEGEARQFIRAAIEASPDYPVLIDHYLEGAIEVDVDCVCDGTDVLIGGVMQHVEAAGVHSGDSACATPPHSLAPDMVERIKDACAKMALELDVRGLMNVQIAVKDGDFYIIEINPRASRTVPYISKATGVPLAKLAAQIAVGRTLKEMDATGEPEGVQWCAVKEAVFPFNRFAGVDPILGPEMKSTGEVMGIDRSFETAYWKSQIAAGQRLPETGDVFLSAKDADKPWMVEIAQSLVALGFTLTSTEGTARALQDAGMQVTVLHKLAEEKSPNVLDCMKEGSIGLVINTPSGPVSRQDEVIIRSEAILRGIPIITTEAGARANVAAIAHVREHPWDVHPLQDYHARTRTSA